MKMAETEDQEQPLIEHLRELKRRLSIAVVSFIAAAALTYSFAEPIYQFLVQPLANLYEGQQKRLIFTSLTEPFFTYLKLAMFGGFCITFPVIASQLYAFVAPGLYSNERRVFRPFLFAAPVLFLTGAAMAYYVIFPLAWSFFIGFETMGGDGGLPIELEAKVSDYLSLTIRLIMAFGIAFQMPIVLLLLVRAGFFGQAALRTKRKYAIIGIFAFAAIITPPDVISQLGLAVPLLLLYEITVYIAGALEQEVDGDDVNEAAEEERKASQ